MAGDEPVETILARLAELVAYSESRTFTAARGAARLEGDIVTKGHVEGRPVWPFSWTYLYRRWTLRHRTCPWCSRRVWADSPVCEQHLSVRSQIMSGHVDRPDDAR